MMHAIPTERLARCIAASKQVRWDIDLDVIRGRTFDTSQKYLPDGLSLTANFTTLSKDEKRFVRSKGAPTPRCSCVFRGKSAADSGMKSATDSDLISATPI
jgi:hypothetical protein